MMIAENRRMLPPSRLSLPFLAEKNFIISFSLTFFLFYCIISLDDIEYRY